MQFIDLKTQQERINDDLQQKIQQVLRHGKYILGPEVAELEKVLADFVGVKHCLTCASGTDALLLGLMAKGVGPGDAVFTSPFTFIATAEVISLLGATPVFVDIDAKTYNIEPRLLEKEIGRVQSGNHLLCKNVPGLKPKAVIPVDLFGLPADYNAINKTASDHGLFVLEDAAQGFGGEYKGKKAGSLAEIAATSFFPAKPLGCYGDGGAVFTDDDGIMKVLQSLRVHGKGDNKYDNVRVGINGRLDTLQAGILLAKMAVFADEIKQRQVVAARYSEALLETVETPSTPEGYLSAWAQYSICSDKKAGMMAKLKEEGIPTAVYYPKPLHLQPAFADLGYGKGDMPESEKASGRIFSLPMHPYLQEEEQNRIAEILRAVN